MNKTTIYIGSLYNLQCMYLYTNPYFHSNFMIWCWYAAPTQVYRNALLILHVKMMFWFKHDISKLLCTPNSTRRGFKPMTSRSWTVHFMSLRYRCLNPLKIGHHGCLVKMQRFWRNIHSLQMYTILTVIASYLHSNCLITLNCTISCKEAI